MKTPGQPSGQVIPIQKPPEEVYFAMAAAQMDKFGKLFQPEPELDFKTKDSASG